MSIINRLFGGKPGTKQDPKIRFGRYSDAYKPPAKHADWERAQALFEKGQYLECYRAFFSYLYDESEDNVHCENVSGGLKFELYQGSKKITGMATPYSVKAEAKIVKAESFNASIMRRLLEQNFSLRYSRFALDEAGNITIVFDTSTVDGSPYKLYYALQEVATRADKQDDLLVEEFRNLELVEASHLEPLPPYEKEVKYNFIKSTVKSTLEQVESAELSSTAFARSVGFMLMDLIFRLDYLIKPEGFMKETLERIHRRYYDNDGLPVHKKNESLCEGLRELLQRPKEEFFKEMYRVKSTFAITHTVNHDRVANFIDNEVPSMDWYQRNGFDALALAIPGYIVGYCMFNYAVPRPGRDLFHLYYRITEPDYFRALGFSYYYYDPQNNRFDKKGIKKAISRIVDANKHKYAQLDLDSSQLQCDNMVNFARTYMQMIGQLKLVKTE